MVRPRAKTKITAVHIQAMAQQNVEVGTVLCYFVFFFFHPQLKLLVFFWAWCEVAILSFLISNCKNRFFLEKKITNPKAATNVDFGRSQGLYLLRRSMGCLLGSSGFQWNIPWQWMVLGFGNVDVLSSEHGRKMKKSLHFPKLGRRGMGFCMDL